MKLFKIKSKSKYYDIKNIDNTNAVYRMIIGQRSNGKTYAVIRKILDEFIISGNSSAYIRRYADDIKRTNLLNLINPHMEYIQKHTRYNDVEYKSNMFTLIKRNDKGAIVERDDKPFLYCLALNTWERSKGQDRGFVSYIVFDEFMTRSGYLYDEFSKFSNILSSLIRNRTETVIYMLANTVNKFCPYFEEMGLKEVDKQEQGTIAYYTYNNDKLTVAVEYCAQAEATKNVEYYYAFDNPQLEMIKNGSWEEDSYKHISEIEWNVCNDNIVFKFFVVFYDNIIVGELHKIQGHRALTFHKFGNSNYKITDKDLVYTNAAFTSRYWAHDFSINNTKKQRIVKDCFSQGLDYYENNTIGEIIRNFKLT